MVKIYELKLIVTYGVTKMALKWKSVISYCLPVTENMFQVYHDKSIWQQKNK